MSIGAAGISLIALNGPAGQPQRCGLIWRSDIPGLSNCRSHL